MHLIGDFEYSAHPNTEDFFFSTIIGQMMSNTVADVIEGRVSAMCGGKMTADAILSLGIERIRSAGVSMQKAEYMTLFAQKIKSEPKFLDNLKSKSNNEVLKELTALRGIGNWTAKMYLLFVLNRTDILPYEDGAFLQAYRWLYQISDTKPASIKKMCQAWTPYESVAARFMYRLLDYGYTKYPSIYDAEEAVYAKRGEIV
jgi:DNA-3-methyladenine glycosylase II